MYLCGNKTNLPYVLAYKSKNFEQFSERKLGEGTTYTSQLKKKQNPTNTANSGYLFV